MDVVADFPADAQTAEPVQKCDGLLHHPAVNAEARAVFDTSLGEMGGDALVADLLAVEVVVVGPVGVQALGASAWPAAFAPNGWDGLDQG